MIKKIDAQFTVGELKSLLHLIDKIPDDGIAAFRVGYHDGTVRLVFQWDGAGGETEMELKVPRTKGKSRIPPPSGDE